MIDFLIDLELWLSALSSLKVLQSSEVTLMDLMSEKCNFLITARELLKEVISIQLFSVSLFKVDFPYLFMLCEF